MEYFKQMIVNSDNRMYMTMAAKNAHLQFLLQTKQINPPQPRSFTTPTSSPSSSASSSTSGTYFKRQYTCEACPKDDHDCRNLRHWDAVDCRLWLTKIIQDSHSMTNYQAHKVAAIWTSEGTVLEMLKDYQFAHLFPEYWRLISAQRDILINRCRACIMDSINIKRVSNLNSSEESVSGEDRRRPHRGSRYHDPRLQRRPTKSKRLVRAVSLG